MFLSFALQAFRFSEYHLPGDARVLDEQGGEGIEVALLQRGATLEGRLTA